MKIDRNYFRRKLRRTINTTRSWRLSQPGTLLRSIIHLFNNIIYPSWDGGGGIKECEENSIERSKVDYRKKRFDRKKKEMKSRNPGRTFFGKFT